MFIALDSDKNRIHIADISSDKEYFCPACGAPLVKRLGEIRIHHFAHKPESPCSDEWFKDYDTSEWHDSWQNMFPAENQEIFVKSGDVRHRADVITGRTVVEFQSKSFAGAYTKRNHFYVEAGYRVIWLLNGIENYNKGKIRIDGNSLSWSNKPQIFNDVDLMIGLSEIFLHVKQDGESCIVKIDPEKNVGYNKLAVSAVYNKQRFLEYLGLVNGKCKPPFIRDESFDEEFRAFSEKYGITLNEQQQRAVQAVDGANLLVAVPGSGKTTVLIARLGYMILCRGIAPESILAITYNRAASEEMKTRFSDKFGADLAKRVYFGDIHQLSWKIILYYCMNISGKYNTEWQANDHLHNITIDETEKKQAVRAVLREVNEDYPDEAAVLQACSDIGCIKNLMIASKDIDNSDYETSQMRQVYDRYTAWTRSNKKMDFDDMLLHAYSILKDYPAVLSYFQNKYTYLSVDEAQDTSVVQHRIIEMLARKNNNIFMVGDEDQSIYGFRGAYPEALIKFRKQYKDPFILFMENNFRSTKEIVGTAAAFIKNNRDRYKKNIVAVRDSGEKVERINVEDRAEQYRSLVERLAVCTEDTAVLYRDNECSIVIADMMLRCGIPFRFIKDSGTFFISSAVLDIKAFIKLVLDPYDHESFFRIYSKCSCYFSRKDAEAVCSRVKYQHITVFEAMAAQGDMLDRYEGRGRSWVKAISSISSRKTVEIFNIILDAGYGEYAEDKFSGKLEILEIIAKAEPKPEDFLKRLDELEETVKQKPDYSAKIKLSTMHSSKGLEFDTVYLIDIFDNMIPQYSMYATDQKLYQEERRLFYVAMTRAKNKLFVYSIRNKRSTFVDEILPERKQMLADVRVRNNVTPDQIMKNFRSSFDSNTNTDDLDYESFEEGTEIIHKAKGRGTIISVEEKQKGDGDWLYIIKIRYEDGTESSADLGVLLKRGLIRIADDE